MKVKMLVATCYGGERLKKGDTVTVAKEVAARWDGAKIATPFEEQKPVNTGGGEKALDRMTTEELTQKAAVLGVDISGATTNKQRAELIQAAIDGAGDDTGDPENDTGDPENDTTEEE